MSAEGQIDLLADYIMAEVDGEPSQSEGAGDCAVRLLTKYRKAIRGAMNELGVPGPDYPAPAAEAYQILEDALNSSPQGEQS